MNAAGIPFSAGYESKSCALLDIRRAAGRSRWVGFVCVARGGLAQETCLQLRANVTIYRASNSAMISLKLGERRHMSLAAINALGRGDARERRSLEAVIGEIGEMEFAAFGGLPRRSDA
jgi:hypothetical protein